jgi:hypothetical protein
LLIENEVGVSGIISRDKMIPYHNEMHVTGSKEQTSNAEATATIVCILNLLKQLAVCASFRYVNFEIAYSIVPNVGANLKIR